MPPVLHSPATMAKLKALRLQRAMTQMELAAKSGVAQPTIARIEGGPKHRVALRTARKLARALGVQPHDVDEFRPSLGLPPLAAAAPDPPARPPGG